MESIDAMLPVFITAIFLTAAAALFSAFITPFFLTAKATAASTVSAISLQQPPMESIAAIILVFIPAFIFTALIFVYFTSFLLFAKETAASTFTASTFTVPPSTTTTTTNQQLPPAPATPFGAVTANLNVPLPSLSPYSSLIPLLTQLDSHNLAVAAQTISSPFVASWPGPYTIFGPTDSSLRTCPTCSPSLLLQEHSVPGLYTAEYLSRLAFGTKIETVLPGRCLTVTSAGNIYKIFVGGAEITRPDLVDDGRVVVHGIQGFLSHLSPYSCSIDKMTSFFVPRPSPSIAMWTTASSGLSGANPTETAVEPETVVSDSAGSGEQIVTSMESAEAAAAAAMVPPEWTKKFPMTGSMEAHSAIDERVTKSLDEMKMASSAGWQRANDIHEDNQRFSHTRQKILILNDRIVMEKNIAKAEKELYDLDPIAMGSPSDKAKRVVERKNTLAALRAQADELIKSLDISSSTSTSRGGTARNLESRFDEEA